MPFQISLPSQDLCYTFSPTNCGSLVQAWTVARSPGKRQYDEPSAVPPKSFQLGTFLAKKNKKLFKVEHVV